MATIIPLSHQIVKVPGQKLHAVADWNADHHITANINISPFDLTTTGNITANNLNIATWDNHVADNSQAHTDYLINNGDDSTTGKLTMTGLEVNGNTDTRGFNSWNNGETIRLSFARDSPGAGICSIYYYQPAPAGFKKIHFGKNTANVGMGLDCNTGYIGIMTDSPTVPFDVRGDMVFTGSINGLPFGGFYGEHIGWTQVAAVNTWFDIFDIDISSYGLNNTNHDGSGKLTIPKAGHYIVNYSVSFQVNAANKHIEFGIDVDEDLMPFAGGHMHLESHANQEHHMGGTVIMDLAANSDIEIAVRTTDAGNPTITVDNVSLTVVQVGGT